MERKAFIFNTNKCVACMACVLGCSIENPELSASNLRNVSSFNATRHPELPVFHFSIACNHCEKAPCKDNCPTLAYTRDEETGAILHHAEACIGCKYCTWACPYDAPKYNPVKGIVEKCTFCVERLHNNQQPACTAACPVSALEYSEEEIGDGNILIPGFVNRGIRPSIRIVPLRESAIKPEILNLDAEQESVSNMISQIEEPKSKVSLKKEWPLLLFSLLMATLVGWFTSNQMAETELPIEWFISIGLVAILLSSVHLGKKFRAWRSILNIKKSWLSREILSLTGFLIFGTLALLSSNQIFEIIGLVFAIICLVSIDMVYHVFVRKENLSTHSAMVLLTGFMVFSILSDSTFLIGFTLTIKLGLYLVRKITYIKLRAKPLFILSVIRLICLSIPIIYIGSGWIPGLEAWMVLSIVGIGEIIDRSEFYYEAEVSSPQLELSHYLNTFKNVKE